MGDGTTYFYAAATAPTVAAAVVAGDVDALRRCWATVLPLAGGVLDRVGSFEALLVNEVVRVDCARWADGRLVLVGMPPMPWHPISARAPTAPSSTAPC